MKGISLLKAVLTQDMDLFKYKTKTNSGKIKKIIFPLCLFIIVCFSIGFYAYTIGKSLKSINLTYIMLTMFIFIVTIFSFMQGIYKSQGILFESKDNDLLFSLPIAKSKILSTRILKLLIFQYLYNLMFLLPAFIIYIYYERPNLSFYLITIIFTFLIPIIPTILSSILGYLVKMISSKSKRKKIVQTLLSIILFLGIFFLSTKFDSFINNIASYAKNVNDLLIKIYYPIGLYIRLITNFNIIDLIKLLLVNLVPFVLFIILFSKSYFKIIFNSKENIVDSRKIVKNSYVQKSPVNSLVNKELKRYFSSPVYMFNTSFGLILTFVVTIILLIKGKSSFEYLLSKYELGNMSISFLYYILILFATSFTSITSSSISLEGKTINITKSLPIKIEDIFKSKIIYPFIIELPFILISEPLFFIVFKPNIFYIVTIFLLSILMILLSSLIGLLVNLKYPKMNATNDTEVVKQSLSSMISVYIGVIIFLLSVISILHFKSKICINTLIIFHLLIIFIICVILYNILIKWGIKKYNNINI